MKLRNAMTAAGICMATTAITAAFAPAASAAPTYKMHTDDGNPGGRVTFQPNGDVVELCDIEADGWAVFLDVNNYTKDKNEYDYRIGGNGRCQTFRASLGQPYNLAEGDTFRFKICLQKGSKRDFCDMAYWANVN
ncbi:hypothetical protein OHR68_20085 [Spirillospora sp. NBC_00431]